MSPRVPRLARALAAYGLALWCSALSHVGMALAREIARRRATTAANRLDLAIGVRAIARELGVSRREAWTLIRSGAVETIDLGGAPCAARSDLRRWRQSRP